MRAVLALAEHQHRVVTRAQLLTLGLSRRAIEHRIRRGDLHTIHRGVYAVGSPDLTRDGDWMAAVLACGDDAVLSFDSAAAKRGIRPDKPEAPIEVSVPPNVSRNRPGIVVHKRALRPDDVVRLDGIPITTIATTLIDLATRLDDGELERSISEAERLHLTTPDRLLSVLSRAAPRPGTGRLRKLLTRHTFRLTDSELERIFIPIAVEAGLPVPRTRQRVNGYRVDFYWSELGLVVETDGGSTHRSAIQQSKDRRRDQAHTVAGLTNLRFTHGQIYHEREHVQTTLVAIRKRLIPAALPSPKRSP